MLFSVLHAVPVPDLPTARRLHGLDDLDDRSVAKVVYHLRKQSAGDEALRWEQCTIGGLTRVRLTAERVEIETRVQGTVTEVEMLEPLAPLAERGEPLVTWDAGRHVLPLLRYRAVALGQPMPALWDAAVQRDLCSAFVAHPDDRPTLDEIARRLGLPGLVDCAETLAIDQWLAGDGEPLRTCAESGALNLFLLALAVFQATGELSTGDAERARRLLAEALSGRTDAPSKAFMKRWHGPG